MHHVTIHDLKFAAIPYCWYSSSGLPYTRWARVGMPKIPRTVIDTIFFLFRDREAAERGDNPGGTGFIVAVPSERTHSAFPHYYAVSCHHAVCTGGYSCIRLNRTGGGSEIIELGPDEWRFEPSRGDIAACLLDIDDAALQVSAIPLGQFLTRERASQDEIGVGEDVFMVGLFLDAAWQVAKTRNTPMARFGNISAMPSPDALFRISGIGGRREYLIVDMHSRDGISGSPVCVFRTPMADFTKPIEKQPLLGGSVFYFLGIHCGQFPELWGVKRRARRARAESAALIEGDCIIGLSGLTLAAPAWDIAELLQCERFKQERARVEATRPIPIMLE